MQGGSPQNKLLCVSTVVQQAAAPPGSCSQPVPPQRLQVCGQHAPMALAMTPSEAQREKLKDPADAATAG